MRVLIVSDTHSNHENLRQVVQQEAKFDLMIHLGDSEIYLEELADMVDCPVEAVAGNMDRDPVLPMRKVIEVEGYRLLLCHGHQDRVDATLLMLDYGARNEDVDIALFGHTHVPFLDEEDGLTFMNPGSLSRPRPWGAKPSYGIMTIDEEGNVKLEHRCL